MKPNRPMGLLLMLLLLTSLSLATTQVGSIGLRRRRQQQRQQQQQQQTSFPCRPGQVTTISGSSVGAGIIETPDFPDAFPLPLFCAWIIDNAGNSKQPFVNIYFTQFYLAPGYLMVEGHNSYAAALNWTLSVLPSDDGRQRQNWQERPKAGTKEGFLALKLVLNNSASYNRLHMRALEMYNSFGFRIAFEVSSAPYNDRADACSLVDCSLTGECLVKIDQTKKKIANFSCACVAPNRAEKIERKFSGSKCGGHEILEECLTTGGRIKCSNHGQCRYLSSRHVSCKCDEGFAGTFCERRKEDEKGKGEDLSSDAASLQHCPNEFVLLNVLRDLQRVITFLMSNFIKTKVDDGVELYGEPNKPDSGRLFFHAKNETALQQLHSKLAKFIASYPNIFRGKIGGNPDVHGGLCAKGMIVTPDLPLRPQVQFHLSCSVTVPMIDNINVKFQWFKDDTINNRQFSINTTLAKRYMATDNKKGDEKTLIGLLTVKEANKVDNGKFKCLAVSEELSRLVRVDLKDDSLNQSPPLPPPFRTSASATLVVVVEQRPDIEVFPRTITIIKDNKIKNQNRTLHCVAGKNQIFSGDASNYLFRWFRSTSPASPSEAFSTKEVAIGETEGGHSGPEFVEDVWMPSGDEVVIYGLLLRLDDIQEDANYTCEVTDRRSGHDSTTTASLTSRVTVRVYVADSELDVCPAEIEAGFVWPQTKKSTVAIRVCPEDERGFVYHKCQPTNEHFQRAVWEKKLNSADCIQKRISVEEENLHRVMNGYFINSDSDTFPLIYFENLPAGSRGRPLDSSEWTVVTDMSNQVLDYLKTKSVLPKMPNLPRSFFVHFVSWLLESGIDVIQPISTFRHSDKRYLDLFKLVYKAAKLFSSKLEIGMEDLQSYPENENPCQTLLSVKMARLKSPLKGIPMGTHNITFLTWNQRRIMKESSNKRAPQFTDSASNDITCAGMTKVEISSTTEAQTLETSLSLTVIHFRKIDRVLSAAYATPNASYIRSFNSSIVTVSVESPDLLHPKQNSLAVTISIQFLDFRFAENDTGWTNLSCGRLEIGSVEPRWSFKDPFCGLSWHPDGLICNCSRQGSVALVWTEEVVMPPSKEELPNHLIVSLSCGASLTMCSLTVVMLLRQLWSVRRSVVLMIQVLVSFCVVAVMAIIVMAVAASESCLHWWTSIALQFLLLVVLTLQICLAVTLQAKAGMFSHPKRDKLFTFALAFFLPMIYSVLILSMEGRESRSLLLENHFLLHNPPAVWFILMGSKDFYAYISCNLAFFVLYAIMFLFARKFLRENSTKKLENSNNFELFHLQVKPWFSATRNLSEDCSTSLSRECLLQRSCMITMTVILFNLACIIYVNMCSKDSMQYLLAFASILLGLVIFLSYLIPHPGELNGEGCLDHKITLTQKSSSSSQRTLPGLSDNTRSESCRHPRTHVGCLLTSSPPTETEKGSLLSQFGCPDCSSSSSGSGSKSLSLGGWTTRRARRDQGAGRHHQGDQVDGQLFQDLRRAPTNGDNSDDLTRFPPRARCSVENSGSSLDMARASSRQSSYCGSSFGKATTTGLPPKLTHVRCLLSPDSFEESGQQQQQKDLRRCDVDVHQEQRVNRSKDSSGPSSLPPMTEGPPHLTEIVQQAQQEAAVDLITQLSDGTLSRNLSNHKKSLFCGGGGKCHPNSSISSSESGYNNGHSRSRKTSCSVERTPSSGSTDGDSVFSGRNWWRPKGKVDLMQNDRGNSSGQCNSIYSKGQYLPMSIVEKQLVPSKGEGKKRRRPKKMYKLSHSLERGFLFDGHKEEDDVVGGSNRQLQQQQQRGRGTWEQSAGEEEATEATEATEALLWKARERVAVGVAVAVGRERTHSSGESAPSSEQDSAECQQRIPPSASLNNIVVCLSHPNQSYGNCHRSKLLPEIFFKGSLSKRQTVPETSPEGSDDDAASDARSENGSKYQNVGLPKCQKLACVRSHVKEIRSEVKNVINAMKN